MTLVRQVLALMSKRRPVGETLKRRGERAEHAVGGNVHQMSLRSWSEAGVKRHGSSAPPTSPRQRRRAVRRGEYPRSFVRVR
jgi:hypothetical protein